MERIHLSNAEWEIMNILWKFPEATITQIVAELNKKKFWDKHTVITLLSRMEKKGAVEYRRNGRAKEYYSIISQKETVLEETEQFLDRVYEGSLSLLVNSFLSSKKVSRDELDDLYEILCRIWSRSWKLHIIWSFVK